LGFLCPDGGDSNCGYWDQVAALAWVRDEIQAFGGDPTRVTIMGESSGADAVHYHLASPASKGLFHQAIVQSPCSLSVTRDQARELATEFAEHLGATDITVDALRSFSTEDILRAQGERGYRLFPTVHPGWRLGEDPLPPGEPNSDFTPAGTFRMPASSADWKGQFWFYPAVVLDGEFMVEEPLNALCHGSAADLRVIVGANREELNGTCKIDEHGREEVLQRICWELVGAPALRGATTSQLRERAEALASAYDQERLADPWVRGRTVKTPGPEQWLHDTAFSDFSHISSALMIAKRLAASGGSKAVYAYQFLGYGGEGASHASEFQLCLGEEDVLQEGTEEARRLWLDSWAAFVLNGDPNTKEMSSSWLPWDGTGSSLLVWDGIVGWRSGIGAAIDRRTGLQATLRMWEEIFCLEKSS